MARGVSPRLRLLRLRCRRSSRRILSLSSAAWGQLAALIQRLHRLGVAPQIAEPGPAQWHAAAHALALLEFGLLAEPDQRPFAMALVTEDLCALLRHQQFGRGCAHAPVGQLVYLQPLDQRA